MKPPLTLLLLLPALASGHSPQAAQNPAQTPAPGQTPAVPTKTAPGQVVPPAPNQTAPVMPNVAPIPLPTGIQLPSGPPNEASRPLTADEAAKLALRVQPSLRLAEAQVLAAQGRFQIVQAGLLPTVSLSATYGREIVISEGTFAFPPATTTTSAATGNSAVTTNGTVNTGVFAGLGTTAEMHQLIFDFNHTRDLVRQADYQIKAAKQGYTLAQLNLVFQVKQAYYTYVQDQALVSVQQANVSNTKEELDLALAQTKAGTGEPSNLVTAETTYGAASTALSQAEQTALIARINLALAIGVDPRTPIVTTNAQEPAPTNLDVDTLVSQAIKQRPDILQAVHTLRAAGYELSAAKTTSAPSVGLDIIGQTTGTDEPFDNPGGALGLSVTWQIIDGGLTSGTVKEARADIETAQSQLQTATQTAISDVEQAYVNLKASEQQVIIDEASEKNAQEGVRLAEGQFRAGVAIFIQVVTAQTLLVQAQSALVQAQVGVQTARAQLHRAIGEL